MFGFLKLFKRKDPTPEAESFQDAPAEAYEEAPEQYEEPPLEPPPRPQRNGPQRNGPQRNGNGHNGRGIFLPLQGILETLPLELQPRVKCADASDLTVCVPLEKILSQLSRGVVRISFGELRQSAPQAFAAANDRDRVMVTLPLADILTQLNPALITRRRVQKQIEVPEEISSPFEPENHSLIFSIGPARQDASPAPAPGARAVTTGAQAPAPVMPLRSSITSAPAPTAPTALPAEAAPIIPGPRPVREFSGATNHIPAPPKKPAPLPEKPQVEPLMVGLTALADGWPDAVRQEIVQLNLVDAKVGLPTEVIERALKQGRIAFTWKAIRSWIRPAALPAISVNDSTVLELPLKVVAPLFLTRQKESAKNQQAVVVDENIPNLFFGFPQQEPAGQSVARATAKPPDTNFYVWDDCADTVRVHESETKRGPSPGTDLTSKYATPNEIVTRTAGLEGVEGALIALPDGLMVASHLPAELNGDTLAAFLPQIFGKVSQCTKELRLGELNNLNFTVGNVPWKIFRVNALFFAAFGIAGEALPTAELAGLAAELNHKPK